MSIPLLHSLPYFHDSSALFSVIADEPWAVFLDSGFPESQQGRFDIIAAQPYCTLITRGDETEIVKQGQTTYSKEDPFELIQQQLQPLSPSIEVLPFSGGALGYFSYDLGRRLEKLPSLAKDAENIPEMMVGIYDWAVIIDHQQQQSWLVGQGRCPQTQQKWQRLIQQFSHLTTIKQPSKPFQVVSEVTSNMSPAAYAEAFQKIKAYLTAGDCYQVNLAQRFEAQCQGSLWQAYQQLRQFNTAPFSAYLNYPQLQILSSSPERFLKVEQGSVETKPIKGTRPRRVNLTADYHQKIALANSKKDRAENVMIVDLLRNDMSKSCKKGSVAVPKLFDIESFATVHHLVSTVSGQLADNSHAIELLRGCFPGGSITGAPKLRAMEIIEELEPNRRGVYCGAIGYIGFNGDMDTNISIRTLVHSDNTIRFWAGGGIVNDSELADEYQESFDKAAAMLNLLKQCKL